MKKTNNRQHILFRYVIIMALIVIFSAFIVSRLIDTTIVHAKEWNEKADSTMRRTTVILPERGDILASDGTVLVTNLQFYDICIDFGSEAFADKIFTDSIGRLSEALGQYYKQHTSGEWRRILEEQFNKKPRSHYFPLLRRVSHDDVQLVKSFPFFAKRSNYKTGLIVTPYMRRDYPYGEMAKLSIGRVGVNDTCDEIHGISGLERALDNYLYGEPGLCKKVPFTNHIGDWVDIPAKRGYDVTTTIDVNLQDMLDRELYSILDSCGAEWGTAVLMEVATGDIKAVTNLERKNGKYIEAYNRATVAYEPGSVVKPITMMFCLEKGVVSDLDEVIPIGNSFAYTGRRPITDSHYNGSLSVAGVIEQSSNIGMTRIAIRAFHENPTDLVECYENIGFFERMNCGIRPEERPRMSRKPSRIDMSRMSYGYTTAIPPMYTLSVYNAIANGGRYVRPRLVKALSRDGVDSVLPVTYIRERICSETNAAKLREMLTRVVEGEHGTARRIKNDKVRIAGKTGTCYHIDTVTHDYDKTRKRLAFCGFFPADAPKYSCMVLVFHPTKNGMVGAPSTSAEVVKNMALKMYSHGYLGDNAELTADADTKKSPLILHANNNGVSNALRNSLGTNHTMRLLADKGAKTADTDSIPSVINLGIRDAVARLEEAGFDVRFKGSGHVKSQRLVPGSKTVELALVNR